MPLRRAEELGERPRAVLEAERELLRAQGVPGELVLLGGSSVPGALTRGDVDLHLRVEPGAFDEAVAALRRTHAVVHPEIWSPTLATFAVRADLPAGLAVTPRGSEHDLRFTRTWALLAADPELLERYNAAKLAGDGPDGPGYEERKGAVVEEVLARWGDHPAGAAGRRLRPPGAGPRRGP